MENDRELYERRIIRVVMNRIDETIVNFSCFFLARCWSYRRFSKTLNLHIITTFAHMYISRESQYFYSVQSILISQLAQCGLHCEHRRVNQYSI